MTRKVDKFYGQLTCGLVAAAVLAIGSFWMRGLSTGLERFVFDRTQRATPAQLSKDVVVVGIDADSKSHLGEWPWPNSLHAQLIDELRAAGSKTVVFTAPPAGTRSANLDRVRAAMAILQSSDIANSGRAEELRRLLSGSVENLDDDQQLIRAMQTHGQVLLPIETSIENQAGTEGGADALSLPAWPSIDQDVMAQAPTARVVSAPSPDLLAAAKGAGHLLSPPDTDEVIRSTLTGVKIDGEHLLPSLAVLAAASATNGSDKLHYSNDSLDFGSAETERRLDRKLSIMTRNFPADGAGAVPGYSYWQVLAGNAPAAAFKDKIVVLGFTDGANADRVVTPLSSMTPRALLVAGTIQSLINDDVYRRPAWSVALQILASLGVIAAAALGLPSLGLGLGALLSAAVVGLLLGAEVSLLTHAGIWLQLTLPCLAMLFAYGAYASGLRWPTPKFTSEKLTTNPDGLRTLALTLQGQGQLDLAYETFRRCPMDPTTLDLLYRLGADFERRRQLTKAADIYAHIASIDANYRDARQKSERYVSEQTPKEPAAPPVAAQSKTPAPTRKSGDEKPSGVPAQARAKETPAKETLGRYEIERQLGKGAMGVVYLGRDPKINRVVAIKAIPLAEEFEDSDLAEARERFFREAEMAGCLNHPGIVTVYDAGEDRGLAYIAMEFLRGEHLSFYAEPQNLLPLRKVLTLGARLADALDYAHRQNVIHRDIKPANIMFNVETDTLKITDFGIARLTDASRTKTGIVLGTPSFMSPEQLEGRSIDGRSDLFALGVTLYQLLSAQLPFRADSMTRLMNKIATEPHTPIRSIRPELPAALETVLDRALAKAADNRYQTGADMAEALRSCLRAIES